MGIMQDRQLDESALLWEQSSVSMGVKSGVVWWLALVLLGAGCSGKPAENYESYRFDDNFSKAVSVEGQMPQTEGGSRQVSLTGGWTSETEAGKVEESESGLVFSADGAARLVSSVGLKIPGYSTESIVLKMKASGTDEVFLGWKPTGGIFDEHRILRVRVPKQDAAEVYSLQMTKVRSWRHREVDQLFFELRSGGRLEIESIELVDRRVPFNGGAAGVVHYSVADRLRPCVYMHCPGAVKYRVRIPERAQFVAGLSVVENENPVTLKVIVESGGKVETVMSEKVEDPGLWLEASVDLSRYAGQEVELSLVGESDKPGQVALWSNPGLFERYGPDTKPDERLPNVILYVIDCLRADHLDAYGYGRETAPNLNAFAAGGIRFERCFATDTWTKSSTASFSTGVDQIHHGVGEFGDVLPEGLATFPELLRRAGYETCVLTENPHTPPETVPRASYSFFEPVHLEVEREEPLKWWELPSMTRQLASGFMRRHQGRPFFLYIHSMELHDVREPGSSEFSYESPEPFGSMFKSAEGQTGMDSYDGAIAYADDNFKVLMDRLEQIGLAENTVVIVTADHGEDFGEHENHYAHHGKPYNTLTHVPLLIRWPGRLPSGVAVKENVALLDLAPTILELAGQAPFGQFEGMSLLPLIRGRNKGAFNERLIVSKWFNAIGAVKGNWKLFSNIHGESAQLFDLAEDFGETADVAGQNGTVLEALKAELHDYVARQQALHDALSKPAEKSAVKVDPQTEEQLKALGYLDRNE